MLPGTTFTFTITGNVGPVCAATVVSNTAYVTGGVLCVQTGVFTNVVGTEVAPPATSISVASTHVPATPAPGELVAYKLMVTNTSGEATVTNLIVTDTLPSEVAYVGETSPAGLAHANPFGSLHVWSGALTLSPGASVTVLVNGVVACAGGAVSNTAMVVVNAACGTAEQQASDAFVLPLPGTLEAVLATPVQTAVGQWITVALTVTNVGTTSVSNVVPDVTVNAGAASLVSGPVPAGPLTVESNASRTFVWTYSVAGAGVVSFSASASGVRCAAQAFTVFATAMVAAASPAVLTGGITPACGETLRIYPNPFVRSRAVRGVIKFRGLPEHGRLRTYTSRGLLVWSADVEGCLVEWHGRNSVGQFVAPGVYIWVMKHAGGMLRGRIAVR